MADIPKEGIFIDPAFTHCEVGMFGSFTLKERRLELKTHGTLSTCMTSMADHIGIWEKQIRSANTTISLKIMARKAWILNPYKL